MPKNMIELYHKLHYNTNNILKIKEKMHNEYVDR